MARLGMIRIVEPMIETAYELYEANENDQAHSSGHDWSTAFHASEFPSDDPLACERRALYGLMGIPDVDPVDRRGRMFMDAGKNLELELVRRFGSAGWLLTADQTAGDEFQTSFSDRDIWLSGSPDLIVIPPGWNRGHVVEVKGKGVQRPPRYRQLVDPVSEMRGARLEPTPKHERQLGAYIGMANREFHLRFPQVCLCRDTWSVATKIVGGECRVHGGDSCLIMIDMQPVVDGTLLYVALDDGTVTYERFYGLKRKAFEQGRTTLARWRKDFIEDTLPPRPDDWMWSKDPWPCRFCPFKKHVCKPDDKEGVDRLSRSHAVSLATQTDPKYSYPRQREKVLGRWEIEDPLKEAPHG
jgi:hypothetical protein